jgi:hypothetical protein
VRPWVISCFGANDYHIIDRTDIPRDRIHFANASSGSSCGARIVPAVRRVPDHQTERRRVFMFKRNALAVITALRQAALPDLGQRQELWVGGVQNSHRERSNAVRLAAVARLGLQLVATADRVMSAACNELGIEAAWMSGHGAI